MGDNFLTEKSERFSTNHSLLEQPFKFKNELVNGAIFYLPTDGKYGGDGFIIDENNRITVSLLEDMEGHGAAAQAKLTKVEEHLEQIVKIAKNIPSGGGEMSKYCTIGWCIYDHQGGCNRSGEHGLPRRTPFTLLPDF